MLIVRSEGWDSTIHVLDFGLGPSSVAGKASGRDPDGGVHVEVLRLRWGMYRRAYMNYTLHDSKTRFHSKRKLVDTSECRAAQRKEGVKEYKLGGILAGGAAAGLSPMLYHPVSATRSPGRRPGGWGVLAERWLRESGRRAISAFWKGGRGLLI